MSEVMVRMGELAASAALGDVLVSLGLGSCIGLALVDRRFSVAGLAHVVLPAGGPGGGDGAFKFADRAVPELLERVLALGAVRVRAVLVGGASMFEGASSSLEVGSRNEAAVREQLDALGIPVVAAATGGSRGRTIRVDAATRRVTVREAGGAQVALLPGSRVVEAVA